MFVEEQDKPIVLKWQNKVRGLKAMATCDSLPWESGGRGFYTIQVFERYLIVNKNIRPLIAAGA